jgi:hypothetical protein
MDQARNDHERPLIKVRAALGKPFSKHCSELHGANSDGPVFTIRFSPAEAAFKKQFSDGLLSRWEKLGRGGSAMR